MTTTIQATRFSPSAQNATSTGGAVVGRGEHIHDLRDSDVCALIDAAGPLALPDLARGLNAPSADVTARVRRMASEGRLRQDEWSRYATAA